MKNILIKIFLYSFLGLIFILFFIILVNYYVLSFSWEKNILKVEDLEKTEIWLVFWASVRNGYPSTILKDRLDIAFKAYSLGKIEKIIVSGDNSVLDYNEPKVMKNYLVWLWVKKEDIYEDFAGFDTYDSIYRARDIFQAEKIVFFTQEFHLKRSLYISERLWLEAIWVSSDLHIYHKARYNAFREFFARVKAFLEVEIIKPKPKFLGETIKIVSNDEIFEAREFLKWEELEKFLKDFSWSFDEDFL